MVTFTSCHRKTHHHHNHQTTSSDTREVYANGYMNTKGDYFIHNYCNNAITSSRYTWYNFIPKNLFEQFHNIANVYFVLISITYFFVDSAGDVSVTILPLFIIVGITMIKDGLEDILRHRTDKQLNSVEIQVLNFDFNKQHIQWIIKRAQSLSVGDVILCKINQVFPCDILLLASSNPTGQVCITTANLDGESNTKKYYTIPRMQTIYSKYINNQLIEKNLKHHSFEHNVEQLYLKVNCQQPNEQLYTFEGRYTSKHSNDTNLPLVITNLALRGARLISTEYVIGMVLYTGKDTKLSLNSKQAKRKYSSREGLSNMILLIFMVLMLGLTIILSILSTIWIKNNSLNIWYVTFEELTAWQFIRTIFRFLFIINYLIPISIIVTIEFQQLLLAFNISNDIEMYNSYDDIRSRANNAQLADELGQVEFLFSDKTGTLTQNQMILRSCCILDNEQVYKCDDSYYMNNKTAGNAFKTNKDEVLQVYSSSSESDDDNESLENKNHKHDTMIPKRNKTKVNYNITHPKIPGMNQNLRDFLTITALCHTVDLDSSKITISQNYEGDISNDIDESYTGDRNEPMKNINKKIDLTLQPTSTSFIPSLYAPSRFYDYEATSPDEKALVEAASRLGVVFAGKQPDLNEVGSSRAYVDYWSCPSSDTQKEDDSQYLERKCFIIDAVLEFDSIRKRMSILLRYPDGSCYILSKGAEIAMLDPERCAAKSSRLRSCALRYVNEYAINGLRTLVFVKRKVEENIYKKLLNDLKAASGLIGQSRVNALKNCYDKIECDWKPIGVTGIEDKLQPGVKSCIQALKEAGIQIWILTGDKAETAITVSQSVGHFSPNMTLIRITNCSDLQSTFYKVYEQLERLKSHVKNTEEGLRNSRLSFIGDFILPRVHTIISDTRSQTPISESSSYREEDKELKQDVYYYSRNKVSPERKSLIPISIKAPYIRRKHRKRPGMAHEPIGLVIDGKSLHYALHPSVRNAFLELCMSVTTVLCCRMTPLQKASVVKLVQVGLAKYTRQGVKPVTAAIGDGGNDVAMILQANIGVGVYGKEGNDAARASDYSVTQFRHLQRLFLLHGHWAYYRITITMLFFYHKCVAFVTNQICLTYFTGFSEIPSFGTIIFVCYNLTMTFLISMGYGMFERHIKEKILLSKPHLYRAISHQGNLKSWYIFLWIIDGVWHGVVTFFTAYFCLAGGQYYAEAVFYESNKISGGIYDFTMLGNASFVYLWIAVTLRSTIWTRDFNLLLVMCHVGTTLNVFILFMFQTFGSYNNTEYQRFSQLCRSPAFWFTFPLAVFIANTPAIFWRLASDTWWTIQIGLRYVPKRDRHRLYLKNPLIWMKALVYGQTDDIETILYKKQIETYISHEQVNNAYQY